MTVYLDYNATSPVRPEVIRAISSAMRFPANPSSVHGQGVMAKQVVEKTREKLAKFIGAAKHQVFFTSSGTESNNWVLQSFLHKTVFVSSVEHVSVLKAHPQAILIPVDEDGIVELDTLESMLKQHNPALVSVMHVNNETGVIQPIADIAKLVHKYGAELHVDASQSFGKLQLSFKDLGADFLTFCAHKVGGSQGIGIVITNIQETLKPMLLGGLQEKRLRAGTENVPAIAGLASLLEELANMELEQYRQKQFRDRLESALEAEGGIIMGKNAPRVSNTTCIAMPAVSGETQVIELDLAGVSVSSGSACTSGKVEVSHVLAAMGVPKDLAKQTIRISLGWATTIHDVEACINAWRTLRNRTLNLTNQSKAA